MRVLYSIFFCITYIAHFYIQGVNVLNIFKKEKMQLLDTLEWKSLTVLL